MKTSSAAINVVFATYSIHNICFIANSTTTARVTFILWTNIKLSFLFLVFVCLLACLCAALHLSTKWNEMGGNGLF